MVIGNHVFTGDIFETILVRFDSDLNFPNINTGENIKAGTILRIPAITLYWIFDTRLTQMQFTAIRIITDLCIVASAVLTGGATSPLLIFEGYLFGGDLIFAISDDAIELSGNESLKAIRDDWNEIVFTYSVLTGISLIRQATNTFRYVVGRVSKFGKNTFSTIARELKTSAPGIKRYRDLMQKAYDNLLKSAVNFNGKSALLKLYYGGRLEAEVASFYKNTGAKSVDFIFEQQDLVLKLLSPTNNVVSKISLGRVNSSLSTKNELYLENVVLYNYDKHGKIKEVLGSFVNSETSPKTAYIYAKELGGVRFSKGEFEIVETVYGRTFLAKKNLQVTGVGNWTVFSKIKMKITSIDADGWLMGKYVNGELQVVGNTNVAQKWDYIVKADGQILVGRKHSWLSQGEDVLAAGELKYNNGKLVEISNASGHYLPSTSEASNFLRVFRTGGVNVDNATLTILKEDGTIFKQISPTAGDRLTYY